jgi:hypothetical protein
VSVTFIFDIRRSKNSGDKKEKTTQGDCFPRTLISGLNHFKHCHSLGIRHSRSVNTQQVQGDLGLWTAKMEATLEASGKYNL